MFLFFLKPFNRLPATWRSALKYKAQPITLKVSYIENIIEDLRVSVYTISEPGGLKVGYIGHGTFIPYLTNWVYGKKVSTGLVHRVFIGSLNREIQPLFEECDLLISHFHQFFLKKCFSNLFIRIPDFVRQTVDLPGNLAELHRKIKTRESQKDLNKIKRNGFTSEITKDKKIFKFWFINVSVLLWAD